MKHLRLAMIAIVTAITLAMPAAGAEQRLSIPGDGVSLRAVLFRPSGNGPFPAVVALHGCGGLTNRAGKLDPRYQDWGELLSRAGIAMLLPDSFGSRGLGSQCRVSNRKVRASRERILDAEAARRWLQGQPWVIATHVSLLGWSNGGIATLWAVRPQAAPRDSLPDFRSAVAFYPGCRRLGDVAWSARIPTLILIGRADDWTTAKACQQMVAGARKRGAQTTLFTYRGAYHGFDRPNSPVRALSGMAFAASKNGRVHVGTNDAARADVRKRVPEWLQR
jgi:dienelactone hydrolase